MQFLLLINSPFPSHPFPLSSSLFLLPSSSLLPLPSPSSSLLHHPSSILLFPQPFSLLPPPFFSCLISLPPHQSLLPLPHSLPNRDILKFVFVKNNLFLDLAQHHFSATQAGSPIPVDLDTPVPSILHIFNVKEPRLGNGISPCFFTLLRGEV